MAKRRLRPKCGVAALAKLLTTLMVAALFASDCALPFDLMLVYPRPAKRCVKMLTLGVNYSDKKRDTRA